MDHLNDGWTTFANLLSANGGHPQMGRQLKRALQDAGFVDIEADTEFEFFGSADDVEFSTASPPAGSVPRPPWMRRCRVTQWSHGQAEAVGGHQLLNEKEAAVKTGLTTRMRSATLTAVALAVMVLCPATARAQVLPIDTTIVDERPVVVLPTGFGEFSASVAVGDVSVRVSADENLRAYRALYQGRIYTAHEDARQPSARLAFDPAERRFRRVSTTIRVELNDLDSIDSLVRDYGALYGKAYSGLGFGLIRLGQDADPALVAELLDADVRVLDAHLHFEREPMRPMIAPVPGTRGGSSSAGASALPDKSEPLESRIIISSDIDIDDGDFALDVTVANFGAGSYGESKLRAELIRLVPDDQTMDEDDPTRSVIDWHLLPIAALDGKGTPQTVSVAFETGELDAGETYYVLLRIYDDSDALAANEVTAGSYTGFTLDGLKRVQHVCIEPGRGSVSGSPDPLFAEQWYLRNTGQTGYADNGGVIGEDLRMGDVLMDGPTGDGIRVAVVDRGLEICHPDLRGSVEAGASYNFNAVESLGALQTPNAFRLEPTDPFNFISTGGHGTSVAGIVAAQADNGIGLRGVAPDVLLRSYNLLNAVDSVTAFVDSLGASDFLPNSSNVDIFNLSWGRGAYLPVNADTITEQVFAHGTRTLRSGLGAIYVKAGGNGFRACLSLERPVNDQIGCMSSNGSRINNLPYVIVVGAFSADGKRSSYSSVGPNLWVSAPGGEFGTSEPALVSVDQMGFKRGTPVRRGPLSGRESPLDNEPAVNPDGDYMALMNGTSAAAPNVTGAIALILEEQPDLTWRDVKYVVARTARRIDSGVEPVFGEFGESSRLLLPAWTENAAGYAYHDWYGFGAMDIDAAVRFVSEYAPGSLGEFRQSGWFEKNEPLAVPDNDGAGATQTLHVGGLPDDASIEAVILEIDVSHDFPNDLGIHLVSPHGTRSVLNQVFSETLALDGGDNKVEFKWRILGNAFFGETPNGNWQIDVFDAANEDTGSLTGWRLQFYYGTHP